jgi:hypothetical protein
MDEALGPKVGGQPLLPSGDHRQVGEVRRPRPHRLQGGLDRLDRLPVVFDVADRTARQQRLQDVPCCSEAPDRRRPAERLQQATGARKDGREVVVLNGVPEALPVR